jgi:hypothetical protein
MLLKVETVKIDQPFVPSNPKKYPAMYSETQILHQPSRSIPRCTGIGYFYRFAKTTKTKMNPSGYSFTHP